MDLQAVWSRRGPVARLLWPMSVAYGAALWGRGRWHRWRLGRLRRFHADQAPLGGSAPATATVPVVVVGNLVAGGAGKTPTVQAIAALLLRHGWSPGIVSRGHGRSSRRALIDVGTTTAVEACGDEPLLLRRRTGCPVVVGTDRQGAVQSLLAQHPEVDVVLSDDGLQHVAMARTLQVVVFDERGIGNGWLLPAGPLRERHTAAPPPDSLVLYNAPRPTTPWPGAVATRRITGAVPLAQWWRGAPASADAFIVMRGSSRPVRAAAGTARPQRFFDALTDAGLRIDPLPLPDHHPYATLPWIDDGRPVLVTEKDAVKLSPTRAGVGHVWVVPLDFRLPDDFCRDLIAALPPRRPAPPTPG